MGVTVRQLVFGKPLATDEAIHQRLSKAKALAVFSSDALSSTAYATEAILLVLLAAGTASLGVSMWIALGISALLLIVAFSYFQTIHAYPNGGGAYIVAKDNLGIFPGLTAAASLLIDYVLTVAVSVSAGVAALTSAFPELGSGRIAMAIVIVFFIMFMNLRGVKESGTFFAIPTYAFITAVLLMISIGVLRVLMGDVSPVPHPSPEAIEEAQRGAGTLTLFLLLRAYAAGCTALTGVEAISNGIPAFKKPESVNAGQTLIIMVALLCTMFIGITFLAHQFDVIAVEHAETTVLSQVGKAVFGEGVLYYYLQFATLFILSLAANTAFADFPRLASLISQDRFLPRQFTNLGDRLVYSNGIFALSGLAIGLIILFNAREHNLLPLYAVGVFLSFTLSQSGMVIHWLKERHKEGFQIDNGWRARIILNGFGACCTFVVLIILVVTKFVEGAWIVTLAIPLVMGMFWVIHRHYNKVASCLTLDGITPKRLAHEFPGSKSHVPMVVLMNSLNRCSLQALEYAQRYSDNVRICAIDTFPGAIDTLRTKLESLEIDVPLDVVQSPFRTIGNPLIDYLHNLDDQTPERVPTAVILPEFVVSEWWATYLHNQTSKSIRQALYQDQLDGGRGRPVISVPYRIGDRMYEPPTPEAVAAESELATQ
ncbi:MAG: APC family permease [Anaerolineales bacterium]|nr:APC family permease [Anaerolineales bacterium]